MREAVIVSTARTPIGRAYRGAFNDTQAQQLGGHAIRHAVARAGIDPAEIEDVVMGAALQQGSTGTNIARQCALAAGLNVSTAGMSLDRQCASGLMGIATAAKQVIFDQQKMAVGGGLESVSLVQNQHMNLYRMKDEALLTLSPHIYMSMLETAEVVARRYGVSRERQDDYALQSQQRTAQAQADGRFDAEIVPMTASMLVVDKATGQTSSKDVTLSKDEGNRPETTLEGLQSLKPDPAMVKFHGFMGLDFELDIFGCSVDSASTKYIDAANMTGGYAGDICTDDWRGSMSSMSLASGGIQTTFTLSSRPDSLSAINVTVDGVRVRYDPVNGWTWDEITNTVALHGSSLPNVGQTVLIAYESSSCG
jgi:acetyl-CoA acetyltransferase